MCDQQSVSQCSSLLDHIKGRIHEVITFTFDIFPSALMGPNHEETTLRVFGIVSMKFLHVLARILVLVAGIVIRKVRKTCTKPAQFAKVKALLIKL